MKIHASAWKYIKSDIWTKKNWTLKVQYFFIKIHASAWQCIESHIGTEKKVKFPSSIFFLENSCKCNESYFWTKKKLNYESSIFFMKIHASVITQISIWLAALSLRGSESHRKLEKVAGAATRLTAHAYDLPKVTAMYGVWRAWIRTPLLLVCNNLRDGHWGRELSLAT